MAWDVTFYYQQELRSEFMNTLLKGITQPGVYNANASIYTVEGLGTSEDGVYLRILPGTTLIFSNGYDTYLDGATTRVARNLQKTGSYIVKCVANDTIDVPLLLTGANAAFFNYTGTLSSAQTVAPVMFVYAFFDYDADAAGLVAPSFGISVPNTNSALPPDAYLPFEDNDLTTVNPDLSYLLIGTLLDNQQFVDTNMYIGPGQSWEDHGGVSGAQWWRDNHVFTARGLPDYSRALTFNSLQEPLSLIFRREYSRAYLTSGAFAYGGTHYRIDGVSWKALYQQGDGSQPTAPTSTTGILADAEYASGVATAYTPLAAALTAEKLYVEIYFLALRAQQTSPTLGDLATLFTNAAFAAGYKIIPYRLELNLPAGWGAKLNTQTALQEEFGQTGVPIVPLDASVYNIERLKGLIENRNFIGPIVDRIRKDEELSPFLTSGTADVLLPLAISFKSTPVGDNSDYAEPGTAVNLFNSGTEGAVNPANVLTFLELQASSFSTFGITNLVEDTYSTLVFLDDSETL